VLKQGEIALVITEPCLTNCLLVDAMPGFIEGLYGLAKKHGALLCLDEAHTFQFAYGGLVGSRKLPCDFVTLGKGLGTGIPFALYGMTRAIADVMQKHLDIDIGPRGLATGGTTYGSTVAIAAAKAALEEVLTEDGYRRIETLGRRLADGLDALFRRHGLDWKAFCLGPRSGYCLKPVLPTNAAQAAESIDVALIDARRVFMANRGIWDAVVSAGPQVSFAHDAADIAHYLESADAFLGAVTGRA
jgi:glutamate-1-semialdehyde aminotransferase